MAKIVSIETLQGVTSRGFCFLVSVHFLHVGQALAFEGVQFQGRSSPSLVIGWPLDMRSSTSLR
jgi:hypothetical protein